ncbi:SDR family oxidoreductase [Moraxellaceae bacterium AER2_44_116]|nr:SDR family oxidoreductase [Moraxellaceae bacterium]TQC97286.1 SDR family oxidoreductase [Moraxellaceae bacterium AER2_44_116]
MATIAIITGASGGIGHALALQLASTDTHCVLVSRQTAKLAALQALIPNFSVIEADVTTAEGAAFVWQQCLSTVGIPTLLAHCVGNTHISALHKTPLAIWEDIRRVNLDSSFYVLQQFTKCLVSNKMAGSAVFVSSVVTQIGVANHEAIAAAKGGIDALVQSAAATYAPQSIRINAVAPALTETPLTVTMLKHEAVRQGAEKQYPLAGINSATDVADVMSWLLSAQRITGQTIAVDGGFSRIRPFVR